LGARHDILIRGGLLFDGTGAAGKRGDVAVRDGRIAAVGAHIDDTAAKVIDAHGLAVAPGFIDIKTHSDFTLPINPKAESKVRQGVTTEIVGHCGFSVAPRFRARSSCCAIISAQARRGCHSRQRRSRITLRASPRPR